MLKLIKRNLIDNRPYRLRVMLKGGRILLKARLFKKPTLKYVDVAIDYRCNMKCEHCFAIYKLKDDTRPQLTIKEFRQFAGQIQAMGCVHVNLQGGEPLIIPNLEDYIKAFNPARCHVSVTTNGFFFNEEWAVKLKTAGAAQLVFSMDSMDADAHDRFRRCRGAHQRVLDAIKLARKHQFYTTVNVTVSSKSLRSPGQHDLFDWLEKHHIPYNPILACSVGGYETDRLLVTEQDAALVEGLCQNGIGQRDIHASLIKTGCAATLEQVYITPYGDVIPCPFIQISLGNIRETPIQKIWATAVQEGLHGHYHGKCWVAQETGFVKALTRGTAPYHTLPIHHTVPHGHNILRPFWGQES